MFRWPHVLYIKPLFVLQCCFEKAVKKKCWKGLCLYLQVSHWPFTLQRKTNGNLWRSVANKSFSERKTLYLSPNKVSPNSSRVPKWEIPSRVLETGSWESVKVQHQRVSTIEHGGSVVELLVHSNPKMKALLCGGGVMIHGGGRERQDNWVLQWLVQGGEVLRCREKSENCWGVGNKAQCSHNVRTAPEDSGRTASQQSNV